MRQVTRSALVAQPPSRMFALINDIESYPAFVPGCTHARIESSSPEEIVATLRLRKGPLNAEITTRNTLEPDRLVKLALVRGPFSELEGEWRLAPVGTNGCRVELYMRFAFANALSAVVFEPLFEQTAAALVDAFVGRARTLQV
ncbi:MAG: type II toxin-antitoxin system RatA family toxin [Gammaproteobacteria bacterium]